MFLLSKFLLKFSMQANLYFAFLQMSESGSVFSFLPIRETLNVLTMVNLFFFCISQVLLGKFSNVGTEKPKEW